LRGTSEWEETYKILTVVEKSINQFKDSYCVAGRKTQNERTLHADLLISGIAQLLTVVNVNEFLYHSLLNLFTSNDIQKVYHYSSFDTE